MKNFLIVILVLLVVGLGGYVIYDKVLEKDNNETKNEVKKDNNKGIKIDSDKEYVYDADYNADSKYNDLKVPYININTKDAKEANKKIKELYNSYINEFDKCLEQAPSCQIEVGYEDYDDNDNVISVVIEYEKLSNNVPDKTYLFYNFDKKTGNLMSNEDLLKNMNLTMPEVKTKVVNDIKNYNTIDKDKFENSTYTEANINDGVKYFEQTPEDKMLFFVEDNELNIITKIYSNNDKDDLFETLTIH